VYSDTASNWRITRSTLPSSGRLALHGYGLRCAIYARVSTDDKGQDPETQLMPLRAFAEAQGWEITGEFTDRASAMNLKARRAWRELLDGASKRRVDIVLCWKLDRCFRSVLDASTTLQNLQRWGVGLRSYTEPLIDTASPWGELLFNLLSTFAQFERGLIRERVKAGLRRAKAQGRHIGRPSVLNGNLDALIPKILAGGMSRRQAARLLKVNVSTVSRAVLQKTRPNGGPKTLTNGASLNA
jgi:DNA invertase Pin-like site-specific DNA recombinase